MTEKFGLTDAEMAAPVDRVTAKLLLTTAMGFDPRIEVTEGTVAAWALVLGPSGERMRTGDALHALVDFYRSPLPPEAHRPRLDPGHLVAIVDGWREEWSSPQVPMPVGGPRQVVMVTGPELARQQGLPVAEPVKALNTTPGRMLRQSGGTHS